MSAESVPGRFMSTPVRKSNRIPIPEPFRPIICMDYSEDREESNAVTFWGKEKSRNLAVLSSRWLGKDDFKTYSDYQLNDNSWVHLPDKVIQDTELDDYDSDDHQDHEENPQKVVYLFSYGNMLEGDTQSAYVLTEKQAWKLLPINELEGTDEEISDSILNKVPGFMSTPS